MKFFGVKTVFSENFLGEYFLCENFFGVKNFFG